MPSKEGLPEHQVNVTYFEMTANPNLEGISLPDNFSLKLEENADPDLYLKSYKQVGRNYIWNYRPRQSREEIIRFVCNPALCMLFYLYEGDQIIGMAECDISKPDTVEIIHFGLIPSHIEKGLGSLFMQALLCELWGTNSSRIFLSTCDWDHHKARDFYEKNGFTPFKDTTALFYDFRYSDFYEPSDAPQIPLSK